MKRMLKKLTAIALAGAMALSLSVTALATTTPITDLASAEGQATGQVKPPTTMPNDEISIRMPTAANGTFDFWFDPHNLIRLSNNALNVGGDSNTTVDVSAFATDTLVYFKNAGDTVSFSKTSDDIEIINRSNVPVSVEMSTTWTKPAADSYTLSKDAAEFEAANTAGEAALSLVLQDTKNDSAYVVEKEKSTPVMLWEAKETKTGTTGGTAADVQKAQSAIEGLIKDIKFEWLSGATAQDIKNINLGGTATGEVTPAGWSFTLGAGAKKPPSVTFSNVSSIPKYKTSTGTNINETGYTAKSSTPVTITEYKEIDGSYTYSLPANTPNADVVVTISRGNVDVAKITVEWDYKALGDFHKSQGTTTNGTTTYPTNYVYGIDSIAGADADNHSKVELVIKAQPGDGALIKTALNRVDGAYKIGEASGGGLEYQLQDAFTSDDSKFQSLKFNLTAAITDSEKAIAAWDKAYKSTSGASMTVKWKVTACDAVDPSAEVTTAMYSASDSPVLKVDWGYGSKLASAITGGSFTAGNGSAGTLPASAFVVDDTDNSVITVNVGNNGNALFAGNGKVTLTFDTGATAVVALKAADAT